MLLKTEPIEVVGMAPRAMARAVVQFDVTVKLWNILYVSCLLGVYRQYETRDICPRRRLGQISRGSGVIIADTHLGEAMTIIPGKL